MNRILVVPLRLAANAQGYPSFALDDLGGTTPLGFIAARFPSLRRVAAVSSFGLTEGAKAMIEAEGFLVAAGDDHDLLGRLILAAQAASADEIVRLPMESLFLEESLLPPGPIDAPVRFGEEFGLEGEVIPVSSLLELSSDPGADRERPHRRFFPGPLRRIDESRITLETPEDLEDLSRLLSGGIIGAETPIGRIVEAYLELDRSRPGPGPDPQPPSRKGKRGGRVVFVSGTTRYGGSEEFLIETVGWTRDAGFEADVIVPGEGHLTERLRAAGIDPVLLPVPKRALSPPGRWRRDLLRLTDEFTGAMLVIAKNLDAPEAAIPAASGAGIPVWVHLHAILDEGRIEALGISGADLVIGDSRAVIDAVEAASPGTERIVLPNGVDLDRFRPVPLPPGPPVILAAARTEPHKGHLLLIEASEILASWGLDFRLLIVGAASDPRSASYAEGLRRRIEDGPLAGRAEVEGWAEDIRGPIARSSVLVIPTLPPGEPFGRVGLYAMAMGRPVVAFDLGGPRDYIASGACGLLVETVAPDALASSLARLLGSPRSIVEMGRVGRERAAGFEITAVAARWSSLLHRHRDPTQRLVRVGVSGRPEVVEGRHVVEGASPAEAPGAASRKV